MKPADAWARERQEVALKLAAYGTSIMQCLPDMLVFMVRSTSTRVHPPWQGSFMLASELDRLVSNNQDPLTGTVSGFPLGRDVVVTQAAVAALFSPALSGVTNVCDRAKAIMDMVKASPRVKEITRRSGIDGLSGDVAWSEVGVKQIVIPLAFGCRKPISAGEVREIDQMLARGDEVACIKFLGTCADDGSTYAVLFGTVPGMEAAALEARLHSACKDMPVLMYKAARALGLLGREFHDTGPAVPGYPFKRNSLASAYAQHLEQIYEQ